MLLKSLQLQNFLSFGSACQSVELGPLNVIIGTNGSGKSNFIEAIDLMHVAPSTPDKSNMRAAIGSGDRTLQRKCRSGFQKFIEKAGLAGNMPRIVPCGSRQSAFEKYSNAVLNGERAALLVDSAKPVDDGCRQGWSKEWLPWTHLKQGSGDGWNMPRNGPEEDCHLMIECMECWILADRKTVESFFGYGFRRSACPTERKPPESVGKSEALDGLNKATRGCGKKGHYSKGERSYELLAKIDSAKVVANCPWAARFISLLEKKMSE